MALDRYRYGDPLEIIIRDEGRTCKGCVHLVHEKWFCQFVDTCAKKVPKKVRPWSEGEKGLAKCGRYKESE